MRFSRFATTFLVEDVVATRDFFVERLGCAVVIDLGWYVDLSHPDDGSFTIDLVATGHASMPAGLGPTGGTVLALVVEDALAEQERMRANGVPILGGCRDEPWGQRHFFAASPGPVIECVQMIEPDRGWMEAHGL